ncbi:hypothetical protein [Parendozoicomonas sp. Alg238-R29]|uniref:hypothetical protein n=1 Tax=Parendozoicomonas sp. Alg238-R29 TaxID=2993446 RepID=UPI00248DD7F8|nr:hypothetical protein [Parendozoicomonas sp. Alg238-R29]
MSGGSYAGRSVAIVHSIPKSCVLPTLQAFWPNAGVNNEPQRREVVSNSCDSTSKPEMPVLKKHKKNVGAIELKRREAARNYRALASEIKIPDLQPIPQDEVVTTPKKRTLEALGASLPIDFSSIPALVSMDESTSGSCDPKPVEANNATPQIHSASGTTGLSTQTERTPMNFDSPELCERKYPGTKNLTMEDIKNVRKRREEMLLSCISALQQWENLDSFAKMFEEDLQKLSEKLGEGTRMYELAIIERLRHHYTALIVELWKKGRGFISEFQTLHQALISETKATLNKKGIVPALSSLNSKMQAAAKNYSAVCKVINIAYVDAEELYVEKEPGLYSGVKFRKILTVNPETLTGNHKVLPYVSIHDHFDILKSFLAQQQVSTRTSMIARTIRESHRPRPY